MKAEVFLPDDYSPAEDEPFMNERQLEYFRRKLLAWKADLMDESRETIEGLQDSARNVPDLADRASELEVERADLRGDLLSLLLRLLRTRERDGAVVVEAVDLRRRRADRERTGQEVVAGVARLDLDELAALAELVDVALKNHLKRRCHRPAPLRPTPRR